MFDTHANPKVGLHAYRPTQRFDVHFYKPVRLTGTWDAEGCETHNCIGFRITAELCPSDCCSKKTLCNSQQVLAGFPIELFPPVTYSLWDMYSILCPDGQYQEFIDKNSRKILHLLVWKKPFMQYLCCLPHRTYFLLIKVPAQATKKTQPQQQNQHPATTTTN